MPPQINVPGLRWDDEFDSVPGLKWDDEPEEKESGGILTWPNAARFGLSAAGDFGMGIPIVGPAMPFLGGSIGEGIGRWMEGQDFDPSIMALEGALNYMPGAGKLERTGIKALGKYAVKAAGHGAVQGAVGTFPRHQAEKGNLWDPSEWEMPSAGEFGAQTAGGAIIGGATGGILGAAQNIKGNFKGKLGAIGDASKTPATDIDLTVPPPKTKPRIDAATFAKMRDAKSAGLPDRVVPDHTLNAIELQWYLDNGYDKGGIDPVAMKPFFVRKLGAKPVAPPTPVKAPVTQDVEGGAAFDAEEGFTVPADKLSESKIAGYLKQGWKLVGKDEKGRGVFKRFVEDEEGTSNWQNWLTDWLERKFYKNMGVSATPKEIQAQTETLRRTGKLPGGDEPIPVIPDNEEAGMMDSDTARGFIEDTTAAVNYWKRRINEFKVAGDKEGEKIAIWNGSQAQTTLHTLLTRTGDLNPRVPDSPDKIDADNAARKEKDRLNALTNPMWRLLINDKNPQRFQEVEDLITKTRDPDTINQHVEGLREWKAEADKEGDFNESEFLAELLEAAIDHQRAMEGEGYPYGFKPPTEESYDPTKGMKDPTREELIDSLYEEARRLGLNPDDYRSLGELEDAVDRVRDEGIRDPMWRPQVDESYQPLMGYDLSNVPPEAFGEGRNPALEDVHRVARELGLVPEDFPNIDPYGSNPLVDEIKRRGGRYNEETGRWESGIDPFGTGERIGPGYTPDNVTHTPEGITETFDQAPPKYKGSEEEIYQKFPFLRDMIPIELWDAWKQTDIDLPSRYAIGDLFDLHPEWMEGPEGVRAQLAARHRQPPPDPAQDLLDDLAKLKGMHPPGSDEHIQALADIMKKHSDKIANRYGPTPRGIDEVSEDLESALSIGEHDIVPGLLEELNTMIASETDTQRLLNHMGTFSALESNIDDPAQKAIFGDLHQKAYSQYIKSIRPQGPDTAMDEDPFGPKPEIPPTDKWDIPPEGGIDVSQTRMMGNFGSMREADISLDAPRPLEMGQQEMPLGPHSEMTPREIPETDMGVGHPTEMPVRPEEPQPEQQSLFRRFVEDETGTFDWEGMKNGVRKLLGMRQKRRLSPEEQAEDAKLRAKFAAAKTDEELDTIFREERIKLDQMVASMQEELKENANLLYRQIAAGGGELGRQVRLQHPEAFDRDYSVENMNRRFLADKARALGIDPNNFEHTEDLFYAIEAAKKTVPTPTKPVPPPPDPYGQIGRVKGPLDIVREPYESPTPPRPSVVPPLPPLAPLSDISGGKKHSVLREMYNFSRGVTTTLDLSAPMRQGLPLITSKYWWKSWGKQLKSLGSEAAYQKTLSDIRARPLFQNRVDYDTGKITKSWAEQAGMKMTDVVQNLNKREESIASNWTETGGFLGPAAPIYKTTLGRGARASNRAYTAYLNQLRADTFESLLKDAKRGFDAGKSGYSDPYTDLTFAKEIADFVNTATGRGPMKLARPTVEGGKLGLKESSLEQHAKALTAILFSPRLMFSRMRMLNPSTYMMASPFVRKQYFKAALSAAGAWNTISSLAAMAGAAGIADVSVSTDPNSADFGKIRIGNTRLDPGAGFQQYLVALSRLISGHTTSSGTQKDFELGQGYRAETRKDVIERFMANKLHPVIKFGYDLLTASERQPFHFGDRVAQLFVPLIVQDIVELSKEDPTLLLWLPPVIAGMGTQTYDKGESKGKFIPPESDFLFKGGELFNFEDNSGGYGQF